MNYNIDLSDKLASILVKRRANGYIHVIYFDKPKYKVPEKEMDWQDRATIRRGDYRLEQVDIPNDDDVFISFPIHSITKNNYFDTKFSIGKAIESLAEKNGLSGSVDGENSINLSLRVLTSNNVRLFGLNPDMMMYTFGVKEASPLSLYEYTKPDLRNVRYERINLGKLLANREYKIGESLPYTVPNFYETSINNHNRVHNTFRGVKERRELLKLEDMIIKLHEEIMDIREEYEFAKGTYTRNLLEVQSLNSHAQTEQVLINNETMESLIDIDSSEDEDGIEEEKIHLIKKMKKSSMATVIMNAQTKLVESNIRMNDLKKELDDAVTNLKSVISNAKSIKGKYDEMVMAIEERAVAIHDMRKDETEDLIIPSGGVDIPEKCEVDLNIDLEYIIGLYETES